MNDESNQPPEENVKEVPGAAEDGGSQAKGVGDDSDEKDESGIISKSGSTSKNSTNQEGVEDIPEFKSIKEEHHNFYVNHVIEAHFKAGKSATADEISQWRSMGDKELMDLLVKTCRKEGVEGLEEEIFGGAYDEDGKIKESRLDKFKKSFVETSGLGKIAAGETTLNDVIPEEEKEVVENQVLDQFISKHGQKYGFDENTTIEEVRKHLEAGGVFEEFEKELLDKLSPKKQELWKVLADAGIDWFEDGMKNSSMSTLIDAIFSHGAWGARWDGASTKEDGTKRSKPIKPKEFREMLNFGNMDSEEKTKRFMKLISLVHKHVTKSDREEQWEALTDPTKIKEAMLKVMNEFNKSKDGEVVNLAFQNAVKEEKIEGLGQDKFGGDHFIHSDLMFMFHYMSQHEESVQDVLGIKPNK